MIKLFSEDRTIYSRAQQVWQILVSAAHNRRTLTYSMVGDLLGYDGALGPALMSPLSLIALYCKDNRLAPLTVLAVGVTDGLPGNVYPEDRSRIDADRERVFAYNWFDVIPPVTHDFEAFTQNGMFDPASGHITRWPA